MRRIVILLAALAPAAALDLPAPQKLVTFTAPWCTQCDTWLEWVRAATDAHPDIVLETRDASVMNEYEVMRTHNVTNESTVESVPDSMWEHGAETYAFIGSRTRGGVARWVEDHLRGVRAPLYISESVANLSTFTDRFDASITVLHDTYPMDAYRLSLRLPQVGIAWARTDFSGPRQLFVRSFRGRMHLLGDRAELFHSLLDTVVTPADLEREDVAAIAELFAKHVVYVRGHLCPEEAAAFPKTMFVRVTEGPGMVYRRRRIAYESPTVDLDWYARVRAYDVVPERPTGRALPRAPILEVHADTFDATVANDTTFVALYDAEEDACYARTGDYAERWVNRSNLTVARMHIGLNDHEKLPEAARPGFILVYVNGTRTSIMSCYV